MLSWSRYAVLSLNCNDRQFDKLCDIGHPLFYTCPIMTRFVGISRVTFTVRGGPPFTRFSGVPVCFIGPTYEISLNWFAMIHKRNNLRYVVKLICNDQQRARPTQRRYTSLWWLSNDAYSIFFAKQFDMKRSYSRSEEATCTNETYVTPRLDSCDFDQQVVKLYGWVHFTSRLV